MPGIWESIRGQFESAIPVRDGRFSPGQAADLILPGNWYNNREGHANPNGMMAGTLQMATGAPALLTEPAIGYLRNLLGGGRNVGPVTSPARFAADRNAIGNNAANSLSGQARIGQGVTSPARFAADSRAISDRAAASRQPKQPATGNGNGGRNPTSGGGGGGASGSGGGGPGAFGGSAFQRLSRMGSQNMVRTLRPG